MRRPAWLAVWIGTWLVSNAGQATTSLETRSTAPPPQPLDGTSRVEALLPELRARYADRRAPPRQRRGESDTFYSLDLGADPPEFFELTATLRAASATTRIYVQDTQWGSRVTQPIVDSILEAFAGSTPSSSINPGQGIAAIVEGVFGPPTDVDGDGQVHILVMDILDGYSGSGGYIAGYYTSHDQTNHYGSNQRDLLYIDTNPAAPATDEVLGTIAHEYQHLVHHRADPDENSVTPFMNEALAELSTFLCGYGVRSPVSFWANPTVALDRWYNEEADYARAALWALYLYEQMGLVAVGEVFRSSGNGMAGVEDALASGIFGRDLPELMADWFLANVVNAPTLNARWGYAAVAGRATFTATHLGYPAPGSGVLSHRSAAAIRLQNAAELSVQVDEDSGSGLRAWLVAAPAGAPQAVQDWPIGQSLAASAVFDPAADEYWLVPYTAGVFSAGYRYEANGSSGPVTRLAYDDGTAEELGILAAAPIDRGVAVRFTLESAATLRSMRLYTGDTTPFVVGVWADEDGEPGAALRPLETVTPEAAFQWTEFSFATPETDVAEGDLFVGALLPANSTGEFSVGLDETGPVEPRSYLYDAGAWHPFAEAGLGFAELMLQLDVEYASAPLPEFAVGLSHSSVDADQLALYVVTDEPVSNATFTGVVGDGHLEVPIEFEPLAGQPRWWSAAARWSGTAGPTQVSVTGVRNGATATSTAAESSIAMAAARLGAAGGLLHFDQATLELPAGALTESLLVTAQPGARYPGGALAPAAQVSFGPADLATVAPVTVRLGAPSGVVARWSEDAWQVLPTVAAGGELVASSAGLGAFTVLPADAAPPVAPVQLAPRQNPMPRRGGQLALQLASGPLPVEIHLYDVRGRYVTALYNGELNAGLHFLSLPVGSRAGGVYFVEAHLGETRARTKLVVVD